MEKKNRDIMKVLLPHCSIETFENACYKSLRAAKLNIMKVLIEDDLFYEAARLDTHWRDHILQYFILDTDYENVNLNRIGIIKLLVSSQLGREMVRNFFRKRGKITISSSNSSHVNDIQFLKELGAEFNEPDESDISDD